MCVGVPVPFLQEGGADLCVVGVQGAEGFVQEEQLGICQECPDEVSPLGLPPGEFLGFAVGLVGEAGFLEEFLPLPGGGCGGGQLEVFLEGQPGEEPGFLEDEGILSSLCLTVALIIKTM